MEPHAHRVDSKHMLDADRETVMVCTNGHVCTVMNVSSPKTQIHRMYL